MDHVLVWERDQRDQIQRQHTALLAALEVLTINWRQREAQYRHLRPHDAATADTLRGCATELAAALATHQEAR